jgi:hypothetical protein
VVGVSEAAGSKSSATGVTVGGWLHTTYRTACMVRAIKLHDAGGWGLGQNNGHGLEAIIGDFAFMHSPNVGEKVNNKHRFMHDQPTKRFVSIQNNVDDTQARRFIYNFENKKG